VFERFTPRARHVLVLAQEAARDLDHNFLGTEHLLLGLIEERDGVGAQVLEARGMSRETVLVEVLRRVERGDPQKAVQRPPFTPRAKKALEMSLREALQLGHNYIGTEHIVLGLIREGSGVAAQILTEFGIDLESARSEVLGELSASAAGSRHATKRRSWLRGAKTLSSQPPEMAQTPEGAVTISFGRFSQTIADAELAAALAGASPEDLHSALRLAVLGAPQTGAVEPPDTQSP
jgi:ATP-dependent Clp protease ATP-binding subunit ClpC